MTVGSLFSGIGGLDLGFERAGFEIKWMCEKDEYCRKVLSKHWPQVPIHEDITTLTGPEPVDVLIGGFPCQDISLAGKGAGLDGDRSGLWWEFHRLIRHIRPRYVVVENVAALVVRGLPAVLGALSEIGYDAEWTVVSAASVGAPHIRERLFLVAHPHGERQQEQRGTKPEGAEYAQPERGGWWRTEPGVGRVANGIPSRVDRLKGLGNAVVPQAAEYIANCVRRHAEESGQWER